MLFFADHGALGGSDPVARDGAGPHGRLSSAANRAGMGIRAFPWVFAQSPNGLHLGILEGGYPLIRLKAVEK